MATNNKQKLAEISGFKTTAERYLRFLPADERVPRGFLRTIATGMREEFSPATNSVKVTDIQQWLTEQRRRIAEEVLV